MKYSYQIEYSDAATRTYGSTILPTATKVEEEKQRLKREGYVVTAIIPPEK
jgi:hypothetical protein